MELQEYQGLDVVVQPVQDHIDKVKKTAVLLKDAQKVDHLWAERLLCQAVDYSRDRQGEDYYSAAVAAVVAWELVLRVELPGEEQTGQEVPVELAAPASEVAVLFDQK